MTLKRAIIAAVVWTVLLVIVSCGGLALIMSRNRFNQNAANRAAGSLGGAMAIVALVGYTAIAIPAAIRYRKDKEAAAADRDDEEEEERPRKKKKPRRADDD